MKLELKHLAPYLPYGLKVNNNEVNLLMVIDVRDYYKPKDLISLDSVVGSTYLKPILRPLSDLWSNNAIEEDRDQLSEWDIERIQDALAFIPMGLIHKSIVDKLNYDSVEYLLSKHYDVFNLIPEGLAIDINTLPI